MSSRIYAMQDSGLQADMNILNRSRVQGFPLKAGFKGCVHREPTCGSEADIPPSGQK